MPWNPEFAEAHADLGGYYLNLWTAGLRRAKEIVPLVRAHARKRKDISDGSWLPVRAKRRLEQPALIITCLSPAGRINEAVEMLEKMVESDPLNLRSRSALGNHLTIAGAYDRANNELRKVLEIDENAWFAHAAPARSSALKAMAPEALRCTETAYRSTSVGILFYQVMCQETETAAGWFEKAVERARPYTDPVPASSMMKPLQASSQWPALAKMMNLPQTFG